MCAGGPGTKDYRTWAMFEVGVPGSYFRGTGMVPYYLSIDWSVNEQ